jgi:hypothetical protein
MVSGKVPVFECVRGAWQFLLRNVQLLLPAAAICAVLAQVGAAANLLVAPGQAGSPSLLSLIPTLLAGVMFTAAVMRKAVRDEFLAPVGLKLGGDEGRLLGVGACVTMIAIPIVFLLSIIMMSTVFSRIAATPEAMEALAENPEAMMKAIEEALGPAGLLALEIVSILLLCIALGLIALLQAATTGEKRIVLFQALRWMGGNTLRVLAAIVLTVAPTLIVSAVLSVVIGPLINSIPTLLLLSVVVGFVGNMLSVPVAALGAILYKGLRPVDFVAK